MSVAGLSFSVYGFLAAGAFLFGGISFIINGQSQ